LAYGTASVTFDTPDEALNEALTDCLPDKLEGGIQEMSLLAYILGKTDEGDLARIVATLPDSRPACRRFSKASTRPMT
jgi:hypothetical protein